jgi:amidohydrolase
MQPTERGDAMAAPITRFLEEAKALLPEAIALRRRIHAHPELGLDLPETTAAVLEKLDGLDVQIARGPSTSGLVVSLTGTRPGSQSGRTILLRGDMDALPMPESTGVEYASKIENRMHACGHDAHTAMLVQAVHLLHRHRDELSGIVKFMFQPGEEGYGGAKHMIDDGLLDADGWPDGAFALHVEPGTKAGTINGRAGTMMASADAWSIRVMGRGGHASMPHHATDPIPVACEIVQAMQTMVTRNFNVFDPVVVTCARVAAGTTGNVIPEHADLLGTMRATSEAARTRVMEGIRRVAVGVASAHSCTAEVKIEPGYPVTVNDAGFVDFARGVATDLLGPAGYNNWSAPLMGAEDWSYVLQRIPGCMMFLGVRPEGHDGQHHRAHPCHSNKMMIEETAMAVGIAMHAAVAWRFLQEPRAA